MTKVILIVGASGAGKDTLLRNARACFRSENTLGFVRRYITRPPDNNEDNFYVDESGFLLLKKSNFFLSTWAAHDKLYVIPIHSLSYVNGYKAMLCSISRTTISDFENRFTDVTTINITARDDVLYDRLLKRGRESKRSIEERLIRAKKPFEAKNLINFDNSSDLERSKEAFVHLLKRVSN